MTDFDPTCDLVDLRAIIAAIERSDTTRAADGYALYDRLELYDTVNLPPISETVWRAFVTSGAHGQRRTTDNDTD